MRYYNAYTEQQITYSVDNVVLDFDLYYGTAQQLLDSGQAWKCRYDYDFYETTKFACYRNLFTFRFVLDGEEVSFTLMVGFNSFSVHIQPLIAESGVRCTT